MVELYVARGMAEADAENVIDVMAKYPNFFLDVMMVEELGLMPPDDGESPAKNGLVTFLAFVCFGFVPLTSYVLAGVTGASADANFIAACVLTALMMLALGAAKAKFTNQSTTRSAALMLLNGSIAATAAYLVSWGISSAL
jgi:vacuolar iron transporter family protein